MIFFKFDLTCNLSSVEFLPVVKVVQVDRIIRTFADATSRKDARLGVSIVVVTGDRII